MSGEGVLPAPAATADELPPLITFAEAEAIGVAMHDKLEALGLAPPMTREDLGWGDLVQFVLRRASAAVRDREAAEQ